MCDMSVDNLCIDVSSLGQLQLISVLVLWSVLNQNSYMAVLV